MSRTHYLMELESVRQNLLQMGKTTISLFEEALQSVSEPSPDRSAKASELEAQTDHQNGVIHDK